MIEKQILVPDRVRRLPTNDWSWIDRRFQREYASKLSGDAVFLYFLLTAVSDKNGLSYYGDNALALRLRTTERVIVKARDELLEFDLIAYGRVVEVRFQGAQLLPTSHTFHSCPRPLQEIDRCHPQPQSFFPYRLFEQSDLDSWMFSCSKNNGS